MLLNYDIRKLTDISSLVTVVLSNDDALALKAEFDNKAIEQNQIDGFRKGKAPIHVIVAKIGHDKYLKDMREYIASKALDEALKGKDLKPIVTPTYEFADWEPGGKFVFTATIYTQPPDPSDMIIKPDIQTPPSDSTIYSQPIKGLPGPMPIIGGKLPPGLLKKPGCRPQTAKAGCG
ncbi:MAG: trigger factor family protein [bacterium]